MPVVCPRGGGGGEGGGGGRGGGGGGMLMLQIDRCITLPVSKTTVAERVSKIQSCCVLLKRVLNENSKAKARFLLLGEFII